jgi:hypothetical protein
LPSGRLRTIPLDSIVGTVDPNPEFDVNQHDIDAWTIDRGDEVDVVRRP